MKKLVFIILVSMMFTGCSTVNSVNKGYSKVQYHDGISRREAVRIAKKALLESDLKDDYQFGLSKILKNGDTFPYPSYWFVSFNKRSYHVTPSQFIVVIDKTTGKIQYADRNYPQKAFGLKWVFNLDSPEYQWEKLES